MDSTGILPHRCKQKANFSAQGLVFLLSTGSQPPLTLWRDVFLLPPPAYKWLLGLSWCLFNPRDTLAEGNSSRETTVNFNSWLNFFWAGQKRSPLECWITTSGGNGRYCRCICRRGFAETFMYLWCEGRCLHLAPARTPSPPTFSFPMKILLLLLHLHFHSIDSTNVGQTPPLCNTATEGSRQQVLV